MALVLCPECQKEVSAQALACPQCAFPYPGRRGLWEDSRSHKLRSCPDCGLPVSKQAESCPHCGVTKLDEQLPQATNGNLIEETWLCPHCETPYTRKVKLQEDATIASQEAAPILPSDNELQNSERALEPDNNLADIESLLPLRSRSPLWQEPSTKKDVSSPRYPRSRKKNLIVGIIVFVLVTASIALGALWQLQGINPLEVLFSWRM